MKRNFLILVIAIICFLPSVVYAKEQVKLSKCVDGDTARFIIDNKEYRTRFLAIDTPEVKHPKKKVEPFGKEASNYTCKRLENAKKIELEYDPNSTKQDKYGRILAWVYVDDSLLQKELVKKGYAKVAYLYGDYKYTKSLQLLEKKAKSNKVGLWSDNKNLNNDSDSLISIDEILEKLFKYIRKEIKSML